MADKNAVKTNTIILAAKERFARFGYPKVTMDEIAADVELGKASLYYYFPTKEDLFHAVIKSEQEELTRDLQTILDRKCTATHKLMLYVEMRLGYFHKLMNLGSISFHSFTGVNTLYAKLFQELEKQEFELLEKIVEMGIVSGEFDPKTCKRTLKVFLHMLHGLRLRFMKSTGAVFTDESRKELESEMIVAAEIYIRSIKAHK